MDILSSEDFLIPSGQEAAEREENGASQIWTVNDDKSAKSRESVY